MSDIEHSKLSVGMSVYVCVHVHMPQIYFMSICQPLTLSSKNLINKEHFSQPRCRYIEEKNMYLHS